MSRLTPRTTDEMTPKQAEFFAQMAEGRKVVADGHLGGPFDGWCLNPSIGRRIWQLGGAIRNKPSIERRYIEPGQLQDDNTRLILSGLEPGERYITVGLQRARPGMPVTPRTAGSGS